MSVTSSAKPRALVVGTHLRRDRSARRSRDPLQPMTGLHIASQIDGARYDVRLHHEDWHGPFDTSRAAGWRIVFLTGLHADFDRMRQLSYHFRRGGAVTVAGGNFVSLFPEFASQFFDAVCVGGIESVRAVMEDLEQGRLRRVYRADPTLSARHPVDYRLLWSNGLGLPVHLVESSRGCSFRCKFCVIPAEGARHAAWQLDAVDAAIESALDAAPRFRIARLFPTIWFLDNNFSDSREHLLAMCERLARNRRVRAWGALVTQNVLRDRDLVRHLAAHKCRAVFAGIESLDAAFLRGQNKKQNLVNHDSVVDDVLFAESLGICVMYAYLFDPRRASAASMREQVARLVSLPGLPLPAFFSMLIPLAGTADFWESVDRDELRPNLRLREQDGETIAYANLADDELELAAFVRQLSTDPASLVRRGRVVRSTIARIRNSRSRNPLYWFILWQSNLRALRFGREYDRAADRTYLGGADALDPQYDDMPADISDADRSRYFEPVRLTDEHGRVMPWLAAARASRGVALAPELRHSTSEPALEPER